MSPSAAAARGCFHPVCRGPCETNANGTYAALIRARRGASPEEVAAAVDAVGRVIDARDFRAASEAVSGRLKADVIAAYAPRWSLLGAAGLVLVFMLMVNLASVLLARAAQREHEVAVARALGANTIAIVPRRSSKAVSSASPAAHLARSYASGARARW